MSETIIVALLSLLGSLGGTLGGIALNSKLSNYRIEQLEKKVDKHNNLIERMFKAEDSINILDEKIKVANHRLDDLEERKEEPKMNESISMLKLTLVAALGVIVAYFNALMIPIIVLVFVMVTDYITGMASAKKTGELSSRLGIMGIAKKVGSLALVAVGMVVDYLISSALLNVGIEIQINYCFAMIIVIWLIVNELISILENLGELGVPIPDFLRRSIHKIKDGVESKTKGGISND